MKRKNANAIEYKETVLAVVGIDDRLVKQIFAVMGNIDEGSDRIWNGAFTKTLSERAEDIQILWQHDGGDPPIGVPVAIKEIGKPELPPELVARFPDATGALYGEVKYLDTPRGNEVLIGIREKAIRKNSIGYMTIKADYDNSSGQNIRNLRELALYDLSPVNWGMNRATQNVKAAVPYKDTGTASADAQWSAPALTDFTDQAWGDLAAAEVKRVAAHFAWSENGPAESYGELKLPHHQASKTDVGKAVWAGVRAAMGALLGARGGVAIPDAERQAVYEHLSKHYAQFEKEPPDFKFVQACHLATQMAPLVAQLKAGRMIGAANLEKMTNAMTAMQSALDIMQQMMESAQSSEESGKGVDPAWLQRRMRVLELSMMGRAA